ELMSSDGSSVRIMTVHASKGLQAPIVIIPGVQQFKLDEGKLNGFCSENGVRVLNLDADHEKNQIEKAELKAEMRRLIYVAVTRAEYRCEIFEENVISNENKKISSDTEWHKLFEHSDLPLQDSCENLSGRHYDRSQLILKESIPQAAKVDPAWQVISYSALTSNMNSDLEQTVQDHDEDTFDDPKDKINLKVFSPYTISGGTGFGNIMHSYLETADFNSSMEDCCKAAEKLTEQIKIPDIENIDDYTMAYGKWLHGIFNTTIADWQGGSFRLAEIPECDRLMELEFCCSLDEFSTGRISEIIEEYTSAEFGQIKYPDNWAKSLPGGILNGFIDMVFRRNGKYYIVDWKTNRLGYRAEDYAPEKLGAAMVHSMYFVQYLLYIVALVRHLRRYCGGVFGKAEYEQLIGGVYYFFIRGMSPSAPGRGVFRSRPSWETVCELEEMLCLKM
ncbi:MAG: PD-(D/E)XK nuclease family protein, partial [Lentisphaeria bacterium]|nr:PD-(D/E)XK nuclease family protein [Lentisphaeria bacterium]